MTDIHYGIIGDNYGQITFESTVGEGIKATSGSIIEYSYNGSIAFENGAYTASNYIIYESYNSTITIEDGNYVSDDYIIEYVYDDSKITINDGYYKAHDAIFDEIEDSEVIVNNGEFISEAYYAFDDIVNSKVTFYNGKITAHDSCFYIYDNNSSDTTILTIYNGTFESLDNDVIYNSGSDDGYSEVNIYNGAFFSHKYDTIYNNGILNIYGGNFKFDSMNGSDYAAVYSYKSSGYENSGIVNLLGPATFETNGAESPAIKTEDGVVFNVNLDPCYRIDPEDFLNNIDAKKVEAITALKVFIDDKNTTTTIAVPFNTAIGSLEIMNRTDAGDGFMKWMANGMAVDSSTIDFAKNNMHIVAIYNDDILVSNEAELTDTVNIINNSSNKVGRVVLADNITYTAANGLTIDSNITINNNGYKISTTNSKYLINEVTENASLTFQNTEMTDIHDSIIGDNHGKITFESTAGKGIRTTASYTWEPHVVREDGTQIAAVEADIIARNYGNIHFIDGEYGAPTEGHDIIESSYGGNIAFDDGNYNAYYYLIEKSHDTTIAFNDGKYFTDDGIIYETYNSTITIEDGNYVSDDYIIEYVYDDSKITINDGYYKAYDAIFDEIEDSEIVINNGEFISKNYYAFDDIYNSKVTFYNGKVTAYNSCFYVSYDNSSDISVLTIHNGTFESLSDDVITNYGSSDGYSEVNIYNGTFLNHQGDPTIYNNGILNIYGGNFKFDSVDGSDYAAIYSYKESGHENTGIVNLLGEATFETNGATSQVFKVENNAEVSINPDYYASPADFLENYTAKLEIFSSTINVEFISNDEVILVISNAPSQLAFPADPVHPEGLVFKYWQDEDGNVINDLSVLKKSCKLYAVFADKTYMVTFEDGDKTFTVDALVNSRIGDLPNIDRVDDGDGFKYWSYNGEIVNGSTDLRITNNIAIKATYDYDVHNYDELISALTERKPKINLAANIPITEQVVIDYGTTITSRGNYSLIRSEPNVGTIVTIEGDGTKVYLDNIKVDGNNIEGTDSAIYVSTNSTLDLTNTTIINNNAIKGGGVYNHSGTLIINDGTSIENNSSSKGGGIYADCSRHWNEASENSYIYINGGKIVNNKATHGGGVYLHSDLDGDSNICQAFLYVYHGEISYNYAFSDGGGISVYEDQGYKKSASLYIYGGEVSYNYASYGGGIDLYWGSMVIEGGIISKNIAEYDGGGVFGGDEAVPNLLMNGGEISYNVAGYDGGGISERVGGEINGGKIYGNIAVEEGDDLDVSPIYHSGPIIATKVLESRPYNIDDYSDMPLTGNMKKAIAIASPNLEVELLDDAPEPIGVQIPFKGYYVDGNYRDGNWLRYNKNTYTEQLVTDDEKLSFGNYSEQIDGEWVWSGYDVSIKTIYGGTVLLYKSNYNDDYQYDSNGYLNDDNATILDNMFTREGYYFTGWNTEPDGSGETLKPGDTLLMDHSKILYAQWKPRLKVIYKANFNGNEVYNDENSYALNDEAMILSNMFMRKNYTFLGWNTKPDGSGEMFTTDEILVMDADKVLYAQWQYTPEVPETGNNTGEQTNTNVSFNVDPICIVAGAILAVMAACGIVSRAIRRHKAIKFKLA